jgi:predicted transposase YdaD
MQQSVIYQEWKEEFRQEEGQSLILRQLTRRLGDVAPELRSQVQALSLTQLEALGEALLDFSEPTDLVNWLQEN